MAKHVFYGLSIYIMAIIDLYAMSSIAALLVPTSSAGLEAPYALKTPRICDISNTNYLHLYAQMDIYSVLPVEDILIIILECVNASRVMRSCRTSLPGAVYIQQLLEDKHPRRIREVLRMNLSTFNALRVWLLVNTSLENSRNISIEEKLAMFIHTIGHGASNRQVQERFSHSGETVSR
jgi:hypothetical protein